MQEAFGTSLTRIMFPFEKEKRERLQRKKDEEREGTMIRGLEEDKQGDKNEERDRCKKKRPT